MTCQWITRLTYGRLAAKPNTLQQEHELASLVTWYALQRSCLGLCLGVDLKRETPLGDEDGLGRGRGAAVHLLVDEV
jgi:hypothetical protein